jgi:hypothetical protein
MLTFNATITKLIEDGTLRSVDVLRENEQPERYSWGHRLWIDWMTEKLPGLPRLVDPELTPLEQVAGLLRRYALGKALVHGPDYHALMPLTESTWELKTADTRIFGFFAAKDMFVGITACDAETVKRHKLYNAFVKEIVRERDKLDLPFVKGTNPDDVLT